MAFELPVEKTTSPRRPTLLYFIRKQGLFVSKSFDGETIAEDPTPSLIPVRFQAPYGITRDSAKAGWWISDKAANSVHYLKFSLDDSSPLAIREHEILQLPRLGLHSPCMIDHDSGHGLLIACYGYTSKCGLLQYNEKLWRILTPACSRLAVTHACWLSNGGYCFVSRDDSILWLCPESECSPRPVTITGRVRAASAQSGPLSRLRLRYVQGLHFCKKTNELLIADANLGCIYSVDLKHQTFHVRVGRPTVSDSSYVANVKPGSADVWLGTIRGVTKDFAGRPVWIDGESGQVLFLSEGQIATAGTALPVGVNCGVQGTGMGWAFR